MEDDHEQLDSNDPPSDHDKSSEGEYSSDSDSNNDYDDDNDKDDDDDNNNKNNKNDDKWTAEERHHPVVQSRNDSDDSSDDENSRTLFDIIKDEREVNGSLISSSAADGAASHNGINWKSFKDRLRLRRAGSAAFQSSISKPSPISDPELVVNHRPQQQQQQQQQGFFRSFSRATSIRPSETNPRVSRNSDSSDEEEDEDEEEEDEAEGEAGDGAGTVSLMALLGQEDEEWDDEEEEEEGAENGAGEVEERDGEEELVCCVCMVKHKGTAFVPCGHSFCRLCSKEMWVSRGNCALCNGYILEILDIF